MKNLKTTLVVTLCMLGILSVNAQIALQKKNTVNNIELQKKQYKDLELIIEDNQGYVYKESASHEIEKKTQNEEMIFNGEEGLTTDFFDNYSSSLGFRAAYITHNSSLWLFRGDYYQTWSTLSRQASKNSAIKGNPGKWWKGVPEFVTASVIHPHNKKIYLFKKDKYYRCNSQYFQLERTRTIGVDGWKGVPANTTAAVTVPEKNFTYFFKGSTYYRFSYAKNSVDKTGVIGKDGWKGVPKSPDLAFKYSNGKYYFFKGEFYYRYNTKTKKVDKKELIKKGWKGLVKGIDAALFNTTHDDVHFFNADKAKYFPLPSGTTLVGQSNRVETNGMLTKEMKTNTLGEKWYTGAPQNIDAATPLVISQRHTKHTKYLFFKGKSVYFWNQGNKVKLKGYDIKKEISRNIPYNIDAAATGEVDRTTSGSTLFLFKYDKYYEVAFRGGNFTYKRSGKIKDKFPYAPDNIDAVRSGPRGFIFYKGFNYYTSNKVGSLSGKLLK